MYVYIQRGCPRVYVWASHNHIIIKQTLIINAEMYTRKTLLKTNNKYKHYVTQHRYFVRKFTFIVKEVKDNECDY